MTTDFELTKEQEAMFQPGCFVVLHRRQTQDAGRVGKIVSRKGSEMLVEFFSDELIGKSEFSLIPLGHWAPVPDFFVEEYEPRQEARLARHRARHEVFRDLGWGYTAATEGKA